MESGGGGLGDIPPEVIADVCIQLATRRTLQLRGPGRNFLCCDRLRTCGVNPRSLLGPPVPAQPVQGRPATSGTTAGLISFPRPSFGKEMSQARPSTRSALIPYQFISISYQARPCRATCGKA